ncbi:hypothetical protein QAD02_005493, partial [Eretmocerus hayati]
MKFFTILFSCFSIIVAENTTPADEDASTTDNPIELMRKLHRWKGQLQDLRAKLSDLSRETNDPHLLSSGLIWMKNDNANFEARGSNEECVAGPSNISPSTSSSEARIDSFPKDLSALAELDIYNRDLKRMKCEMNAEWPRQPDHSIKDSRDELKELQNKFNLYTQIRDKLQRLLSFTRAEYALAEEIWNTA